MSKHDLTEDRLSEEKMSTPDAGRLIRRRELLKDGAALVATGTGLAMLGQLTTRTQRLFAAPRQSARDTIVVGWHQLQQSLDPIKQNDLGYAVQVSETMWRLEGGSPQIKPSLATDWQTSSDGKEWTFKIRRGVRFHDGTPMNAKDIQFAFDRWMNPKNPLHDPPYGAVSYHWRALQRVQVIDNYTFKIILKRVDPAFDSTMLYPFMGIVSPTALKRLGNQGFGLKPVFTGPWRVAEWNKGTRLVFERFDRYYGRRPLSRRLIFRPVIEDAVRLGQLQSGEVDVISQVPPQFLSAIQSDPNLRLLQAEGNHIWWITLNVRDGPTADKRVRQALNYAINKEAIVRDLLKGGATVAAGPIMVPSWARDPTLRPYPYDPKKAKELLDAARYPDGFRIRFWVPQGGSGMLAPTEIATVVQAQLREVGVVAEIVPEEWASYLDHYSSEGLSPKGKPAFAMAEMSWNTPTPDPYLSIPDNLSSAGHPPHGYNSGYYANSKVDQLLNDASTTIDRGRRKSLYFQAQRIIYDEAPWIFMFSGKNLMATRKNVTGLEVSPCPWWFDFTRTQKG